MGTPTNRAALGAKLRVDLKQPDGTTRSIYRTIGASSNYSGNSLVQLIGLGDAASIAAVEVSWPASRTTQTFRDLKPDSFVEITEGADAPHLIEQPRLPSPAGP